MMKLIGEAEQYWKNLEKRLGIKGMIQWRLRRA